jgi:hypothetical protein
MKSLTGKSRTRRHGCLVGSALVLVLLAVAMSGIPTSRALAAQGNLAWAVSAGGPYWDYSNDIAAFADGSVVVTGNYLEGPAVFGEGETNETVFTSAGREDIFVAKYNPDGTLSWANAVGGTGEDMPEGVAALPDGSAIVAGSFEDTVVFGEGEPNETALTSGAAEDIFAAKYNPDGTLAWAKRAGGGWTQLATAIATLSDGGALLAGTFVRRSTFGEGEPNETTLEAGWGYNPFVAKYDPDGMLVWAKRLATQVPREYDYYARPAGIGALPDDGAVITGLFEGTVTFAEGEPGETVLVSVGASDIFLARYGPDGTLEWVTAASGPDEDVATGVGTLQDGSVLVTGSFYTALTFGEGELNEGTLISAGSSDLFVAKYNFDGTLAWAKRAGGYNWDASYGIAALADGTAFVVGYSHDEITFGEGEPNETTLTAPGYEENVPFLVKYKDDGTPEWALRVGRREVDCTSVSVLPDGAAFVTGDFDGAPLLGEGQVNETRLISAGRQDVFVAKYEQDSDDDGLPDSVETNTGVYVDESDTGTGPYNPDTDGDGLTDLDEVYSYPTDPNDPDGDGDGLSDGDEVNVYLTDPLDTDTDDDGFTDDYELSHRSDPTDPHSLPVRGGSCFIATAAHGTSSATEVRVLCEFRDKYLLTNRAGAAFVRTYYRFSPPVARFIAARAPVRAAIRVLLAPVVALVNSTPILPEILTVIALCVLLLAAKRRGNLFGQCRN